MIKAFLFDMDGVLVDTAKYHYLAWKKLTNHLGFDIDESFNEMLKGVSRTESLELILEHGRRDATEEEKVAMAAQKNADFLEMIQSMCEVDILPGVMALLEDARSQNIKIALGSSSKNARLVLEKTNLLPFFDEVVDGTLISKAKPNPEVFEKGAALLKVKNEECIVFEDAIAGIEAAKIANMKAVGIGDAKTLSKADIVFKNLGGIDTRYILDHI